MPEDVKSVEVTFATKTGYLLVSELCLAMQQLVSNGVNGSEANCACGMRLMLSKNENGSIYITAASPTGGAANVCSVYRRLSGNG